MEKTIFENIEQLSKHAQDAAPLGLRWLKLKAVEGVSKAVGFVVKAVVGFLIIVFAIIMGSFALAFYVGDLYNSVTVGFLTITAFYIVLIVCFKLFLGNLIKRLVMGSLIQSLLKK